MPPKNENPEPEAQPVPEQAEHDEQEGHDDEVHAEVIFENAKKIIQKLLEEDRQILAGEVKRLFDFSYNQNEELNQEREAIKQINVKLEDIERKLSFMNTFNEDLQDTIAQLKGALEDSWREIDAGRTREQNIQDQLQEYAEAQSKDSKKQSAGGDDGDEGGGGGGGGGPMGRYKQIIMRERDRLSGEVREVERRLVTQRLYGETLEQLCQRLEENNSKLAKEVEAFEVKELKKGKEMAYLRDQIHELTKTNANLNQKCDIFERKIGDLEQVLKLNQADMEKLQLSFEKLKSSHTLFQKKMQTLVKSLRSCVQDKTAQDEAVKILQQTIRDKDNNIFQLTQKLQKLSSDYRAVSSRIYKLDKTNDNLNQEIQKQKTIIQRAEKDTLVQQKVIQNLQRVKDLILHERDKLRSEIRKLNTQVADMKHINTLKNNIIGNLQMDIAKLKNKIDELRNTITKVEKERDEQAQEVESLNDKIDGLNEQIQFKTETINDLKKELADKQTQLLEVQQILEKTRSERLVLQMSLQRCTEDRSTLKSLQAKTNHQISQLTEEIVANHNKINNLNLRIEKLERDKQDLKNKLRDTKQTLQETREELRDMKMKNEKLHKDLEEDEKRLQRIMHILEETRKDKNLIGLQMVRRNDEISLLQERLGILNTTLNRGHALYNQRIEDIRLLKLKITNLSTERDVLANAITNTANMREELVRLQRALNEKTVECTALAEQAKIPVNVHRWRILRGSDPDRYTALVKIRVLQKRIIKLYVEGAQREKVFQNFQKVYENLKEYTTKIPNQEIKENLVKTQKIIKERETKLKSVTAELNTKAIDIKAMECKIDELNKIMRSVKLDLIKAKEHDKDPSSRKTLGTIIYKLGKV